MLRSCSDSSRAGWLRSIVLVPKGLVSDGRQAVKRSSATAISATTSTSAPAPTSRPASPPRARGAARRRHDWSIQWAARAIDGSLSRLGVEPIDLWQLHHPDMRALESDELFDFLEQQVVRGKIRAYGVALGPGPGWVDEGAAALRERGAASARTVFSVFEQNPGRELAEIAAEAGAGVVVRSPLDARTADPRFQHLDFLTMDRDQTLGQALVRFALTLPAVAAVLPTFDDAARLAELATASDLPDLTAERLQAGFRLDDQDGRPAREAHQ